MQVVLEHRFDIVAATLEDASVGMLPSQPKHAAAAGAAGAGAHGVDGVNPRLLPLARQAPLSPQQRSLLTPHWHSFLNESRILRQELRATLARIAADPSSLQPSATSAQASAQVSAFVPRSLSPLYFPLASCSWKRPPH